MGPAGWNSGRGGSKMGPGEMGGKSTEGVSVWVVHGRRCEFGLPLPFLRWGGMGGVPVLRTRCPPYCRAMPLVSFG